MPIINNVNKKADYNIILFLCNWGPHAAFQTLQDNGYEIPPEIKMVRIPCTGRINKSLIIKAFEKGADGVAIVGCSSGTCRYGSGTTTVRSNTDDDREILAQLGLGKKRLRLATFLPNEYSLLQQFLEQFCKEVHEIGHTPVKLSQNLETCPSSHNMKTLSEIVSFHNIFACQDCGKCSAACPLALIGKPFSPRAIANLINSSNGDLSVIKKDIWSCLTCGLCYERCPSSVNFPEFIRDVRHFFTTNDLSSNETHGGFFHSLMRTMTFPELKPRRWRHLPDNIIIDDNSHILFFGGCAPYYDIFFRRFLGVQTSNMLIDSLRLLNFFDIKPALLYDERCCGHDLLWSGDKDSFYKLAKLNVKAIQEKGIKEVITACPECYRTLSHDYVNYGIDLKFKVTHIYEFLEEEIGKGAVGFKKFNKKITYQDSCRLSRLEQRSDLPRKLLKMLKPVSFNEMQYAKGAAICCGNCAWVGCDSFSKALQVDRLKQARNTGGELLVTSCPKCQIHLKCAMEDPMIGKAINMEMIDLISIIAKTIFWE